MISTLPIVTSVFMILDLIVYNQLRYILKNSEEINGSSSEDIQKEIVTDNSNQFILQNNISYIGKLIWFITHLATIWLPLVVIQNYKGLSLMQRPTKEIYNLHVFSIIIFFGSSMLIRYLFLKRKKS